MRKTTKIIAALLSVALVATPVSATITLSPVAVGAAENALKSPSLAAVPIVVSEKTSMREQCVKHFQLSDGSYRAVVYYEPVHYRQGDEWTEIDNSLVSASLIGEPLTGKIKRNTKLTANEKQDILRYKADSYSPYNGLL